VYTSLDVIVDILIAFLHLPDRADLLSIVSADLQSVPAKIGRNVNQKIAIGVDVFQKAIDFFQNRSNKTISKSFSKPE
jgi:hypothetical protein